MNEPFRTRWVAALRSGEYQQLTGSLHDYGTKTPDAYCCLGVALELLAAELHVDDIFNFEISDNARVNGGHYYLAEDQEELPSSYAYFLMDITPAEGTQLARLNDAQFTFNQIADIIEADRILDTVKVEENLP